MFNSFSKYFSMTGWRIGWMLVPERLRRPVDVLTGNFTICPPVLAQHAAVAAFSEASYAECDGHVARYADEPRGCCSTACPGSGIDRLAPADGAFYVYADVGHLTDDSMAFCHRLLARDRRRHGTRGRLRHRGRQPVRPAVVRGQHRPRSPRRSSGWRPGSRAAAGQGRCVSSRGLAPRGRVRPGRSRGGTTRGTARSCVEQVDEDVVGVRHGGHGDAGDRRVHDRRRAALGEAAGAAPAEGGEAPGPVPGVRRRVERGAACAGRRGAWRGPRAG